MKLLMLIVDEDAARRSSRSSSSAPASSATRRSRAPSGSGTTGPRLGSRAFPKTSAVIFTVRRAEERLEQAASAQIREYCHDCGETLKMFVWDVEEVL